VLKTLHGGLSVEGDGGTAGGSGLLMTPQLTKRLSKVTQVSQGLEDGVHVARVAKVTETSHSRREEFLSCQRLFGRGRGWR
jgi:hypothetical protein